METSITACVQYVSRSALRRVMRDAHEHLRRGPYRLLPRALDLIQSTKRQVLAVEQTIYAEEGPCLQVSRQYILCQDRYIMEVESQNYQYRDMLF